MAFAEEVDNNQLMNLQKNWVSIRPVQQNIFTLIGDCYRTIWYPQQQKSKLSCNNMYLLLDMSGESKKLSMSADLGQLRM